MTIYYMSMYFAPSITGRVVRPFEMVATRIQDYGNVPTPHHTHLQAYLRLARTAMTPLSAAFSWAQLPVHDDGVFAVPQQAVTIPFGLFASAVVLLSIAATLYAPRTLQANLSTLFAKILEIMSTIGLLVPLVYHLTYDLLLLLWSCTKVVAELAVTVLGATIVMMVVKRGLEWLGQWLL